MNPQAMKAKRNESRGIFGVVFSLLMAWMLGACGDAGDLMLEEEGNEVAVNDQVQELQGRSSIKGRCPAWECTTKDCSTLIPMPGAYSSSSNQAISDGYYIETPARYAYIRKDLAKLLIYAACEVDRKFPPTSPLSLNDIGQADGKTPGMDVKAPRHPTTTHVNGHDIDVAYYQTDGDNNAQIICGDGSDQNANGRQGKYNDGYFCTTSTSIVDWDRQVWFLAKLFESNKARVFGIDQMLVRSLEQKVNEYAARGEISRAVAESFSSQIGWGQKGGWAYHHHHIHLSFR
jgi:hypothetical protein